MAITPLPTPPSRSQSPATFSTDADAFLGALPDFATEANALAADVNADEASAAASATTATNAASIAVGAANYQGAYSAGVTYQIGQSVSSGGRQWVAKTVNTGITPVEGANWLLINDGDVLGPVSAVNNALALYDGTTGKIIKGGINNGTAGQALISGGAGNVPVWQAVGGTLNDTFTAVAGITAGKVVQYTTGTNVEEVTGSITPFSTALGTFTNIGSVSNQGRSRIGISDDGTRAVALIVNGTSFTARVGTISGNDITWGSGVNLTMAGTTTTNAFWADICFYPGSNTEFAIIGYDNTAATNNGYVCHFGTISGTTASFTRVVILGGTQNAVHRAFIYAPGAAVLITSSSLTMQGLAFTFTGTSITAGSVTTLVTSFLGIFGADIDKLSSNQIIVAYCNNATNAQVGAVRISASGTVVSAGTPTTSIFNSLGGGSVDITCDKRVANRFFLSGMLTTTALQIRTGTVSGSSISISAGTSIADGDFKPNGDAVYSASTYLRLYCPIYGNSLPAKTRLLVNYYRNSASAALSYQARGVFEAQDDTSAPTYSTIVVQGTGNSYSSDPVTIVRGALSNVGFVISHEFGNTTYNATAGSVALTYIVTNLSDAKIVGIASNTVTTGQLVTVDLLGGYNRNQAGLTNWAVYYVDPAGALTTTSTAPNVKIGKSTSATAIQIKAPTI